MMPVKEGSRARGNERKQDSLVSWEEDWKERRMGMEGSLMKKGKGEGKM